MKLYDDVRFVENFIGSSKYLTYVVQKPLAFLRSRVLLLQMSTAAEIPCLTIIEEAYSTPYSQVQGNLEGNLTRGSKLNTSVFISLKKLVYQEEL